MHYPESREYNKGVPGAAGDQNRSNRDISHNLTSRFNSNNSATGNSEGKATASKKKPKKNSKKKKEPETHLDNTADRLNPITNESDYLDKEYEELDPSSAFVAQVVNKLPASARGKVDTHCDNSEKNKNLGPKMPKQSYVYGVEGYRKACQEQYEDAIDLCSKAIDLEPTEHRFFGNRSFCYTKLHKYSLAVKDAEEAIRLNPNWPKGYYRKAEAFVVMKKYEEAKKLFTKVLLLEPDCGDAYDELMNLQAISIADGYGFKHSVALTALHLQGTVEKALHYLLEQNFHKASISRQTLLPSNQNAENLHISEGPALTVTTEKTDPRNPHGVISLWVWNIAPNLDEGNVKDLFSKYGQVTSVKIVREKNYAFINFADKTGPGKAMKALQGKNVNGKCLLIKFPDKLRFDSQHNIILRKKVTSGPGQGTASGERDCLNWVNYGSCKWGDGCTFKHDKGKQGNM